MDWKKYWKYVLTFSLFVLIGLGGILAEITTSTSVTNNLSLNTVDILLDEYMLKNGKEEPFHFEEYLQPDKEVSLIPRITNQGVKCYVRVKVDFQTTSKDCLLTKEHLTGINQDWVYKNDYFYYTKPLEEYASIDLCNGFAVPGEWGNEMAEEEYNIDFVVDAIQCKNFEPDFSSEQPWFDVTVEKTVRSRGYEKGVNE